MNYVYRITPRDATQNAFALMTHLDDFHNSLNAVNTTHYDGGYKKSALPGSYINHYLNTALMADRSESYTSK